MTRQQAEAWRVEHALSGGKIDIRNAFTFARVAYGTCNQCDRTVEFLVKTYPEANANHPPRLMRCKCGAFKGLYKDFSFYGPCDRCKEIPVPTKFKSKSGHEYWQPACPCGWTRVRPRQVKANILAI